MDTMLIQKVRDLEVLKKTLSDCLVNVEASLEDARKFLVWQQKEEACVKKLIAENKFFFDRKYRRLAEYFKLHGLLITSIPEVSQVSKDKFKLAKHIWSRYKIDYEKVFKPFLRFIYERKENTFSVDGLDGTQKAALCNACTQLKKMKWLDWDMDKKKTQIRVKERSIPKAEYSYFNGGWAEDAMRYLIEKTLHEIGIPAKGFYRNVKLDAFAPQRGQDVHEFDFIVEFADRFYIFETKTGRSLGVERWIDHARRFNDREGPNRFLMCSGIEKIDERIFWPYKLFHFASMEDELKEFFKKEFANSRSGE